MEETVLVLGCRGAQLDLQNSGGVSPLMVAAFFGQTPAVELLLLRCYLRQVAKVHVRARTHAWLRPGVPHNVVLAPPNADRVSVLHTLSRHMMPLFLLLITGHAAIQKG